MGAASPGNHHLLLTTLLAVPAACLTVADRASDPTEEICLDRAVIRLLPLEVQIDITRQRLCSYHAKYL